MEKHKVRLFCFLAPFFFIPFGTPFLSVLSQKRKPTEKKTVKSFLSSLFRILFYIPTNKLHARIPKKRQNK
jgi:hypothetical protein